MSEFSWYEKVSAADPPLQGDLIDSCPVLTFGDSPRLDDSVEQVQLVEILQQAAGVQMVRAIVMTQACDIVQGHVRSVILCPIYHLDDWKSLWEEAEARRGNRVTSASWGKYTRQLKQGMIWNLALLNKRTSLAPADVSIPCQVVDFHEVFSLPLQFLSHWVRVSGGDRLRLLPPYREHLSQAFARFFMRVGLPVEIEL
ncbi:MAG: hypothetical protein ABSH28_04360 [Acidobacteriota bacterium]|jgi:hypothetical protein